LAALIAMPELAMTLRTLTTALAIGCAAIACAPERDDPPIAAGVPAQAIRRGLAYLGAHRADVSALIVLDYLQRKYALPAEFGFETMHGGEADDARLVVWGRFVGDDRLNGVARLGGLTAESGIEPIVMHALYCDRFGLPATYGVLLQRLAERGDYELTHAALAAKLIRDHGCPVAGIDLADFAQQVRRQLRGVVRRVPPDRRFEALDVRYEAIAILQDFLADHARSPSAITRLLAEQQPDGGWRPATDLGSAPHPTVMAVWALLGWVHPEVAEHHFARR
jgi:hypothetical protein